MTILIKILQLILCLSILVIVHEFGHFIAARIFKTRVNKFYIFFNPNFSLIKWKKINGKLQFKFFSRNLPDSEVITDSDNNPILGDDGKKQYKPIDINDLDDNDWRKHVESTEFGVGWIPLGGYCQIAGMIDETQSTENLSSAPQSYEYRSKPTWQRLIIILAGVFMNLVAAMVIYIGLLNHYGEEFLPNANVKYGISVDSLGYELGLRNGDYIVSVDNEIIEDFYKIPQKILIDQAKTIQVRRNDQIIDISVPNEVIAKMIKATSTNMISPRIPFIVGGFSENSPAQKAGIIVDDRMLMVNNISTEFYDEFKQTVTANKGNEVNITVLRNSDTLNYLVQISEEGLVGIYANTANIFETEEKSYTLLQAIPAGCTKAFTQVGSYLKSLKLLFLPEAKGYESLGSFISIGSIFPGFWDWNAFWHLTAFISIILAIMNVLPIPALDGGYALLIIYEMITHRKPSDKFMERAVTVGWILLLALLALATWNDLTKFIFK